MHTDSLKSSPYSSTAADGDGSRWHIQKTMAKGGSLCGGGDPWMNLNHSAIVYKTLTFQPKFQASGQLSTATLVEQSLSLSTLG